MIIIDDGSEDNTKNIIDSFDDNRIKYIYQVNSGVSVARNIGLDIARGEYITFLDADDIIPRNAIKDKAEYLNKNKNIDMVHGEIIISNENFKIHLSTKKTFKYKNLLQKILHLDKKLSFNIGYMIRLNKIYNTRFNTEMSHCEDILFLVHLLSINKLKYSFIYKPMYYYRVTNSSAMSNMKGWRDGYIKLIKNISNISEISYLDTLIMRLKILKMLISWHLKNRYLLGIFDIFIVWRIK